MNASKKYFTLLSLIFLITFAATAGMAMLEGTDSVTGMVEQSEAGVFISADDGDYLVGGSDLSAMVGKMVTATGNIIEDVDGLTIVVSSFEEVQ
jgi:hypothetical protein